ncbi:MAG: transglycosylase domain-containing protein, partial [Aurantimonas coralicida]|nr:transglycosylase domain-containing protein [Aurantimonas coralicida]
MSARRRLAQLGLLGLLLAIAILSAGYSAFEQAVTARIAAIEVPATGVEVRDRDGALLRAFANGDGRWRLAAGAGDVDPRYLEMLVAWEDKRFAEHGGVDPVAFVRAAWQSLAERRIVSGGSTLTMQVARLSGRLPTGSFAAKAEQILVALALERSRTKAEILSLYLQLAPYGGNLEGVRAAALSFFGKEPKRLTAAEAALLVALPQSPERYRPDRYADRAKSARDRVIARMATLGLISDRDAERAMREAMPTGRRALPMLAAHASVRLHRAKPEAARIDLTIDKALQARLEDYARQKAQGLKKPASLALLVALPQSPERYRPDRYPDRARAARDRVIARMATLGLISDREAVRAMREAMPSGRRALPMLAAHASVRVHQAKPEAARIDLTIDKALQARLEDYARQKAQGLKKPVSLALLVADAATGEVLAQLGSPDLFDRERQGFVDLTRATRSPGSTLKPLIYGLSFERGIAHPESLVDDSPGGFAGYTPQNFDREFEGVITARRALQLSRNLPAVELLGAVGPSRLVYRMRRAGAAPELGDRSLPGLAIGLGGLGLTLEDLVRIYGGLANGGVAMPLHVERSGEPVMGKRILSPQAAWYVTSILAGASTTTKGSPGDIAFKTGTSYGYRDAWTIGYDGRHV